MTPDLLQGAGIIGGELPIELADEHQVAGRRQHAAVGRVGELGPVLGLAGGRIDGLEAAVATITRRILGVAAAEPLARLERAALVDEALLLDRFDLIAAFGGDQKQGIEIRVVGARRPILAAVMGRAHPAHGRGARAVCPLGIDLHVLCRIVIERLAGLGVEAGRPGHLVDILLAGHERAVDAVERVVEAVARRMHDQLAILAVDFRVDDRVLGYLVEVIGIIRRVLEPPFDGAGRGIERKHARRPLIVAGPVLRIPVGAGIADALVERVGLRVIGRSFPD